MTSFADLTKQVHLINNIILTDMVYNDNDDTSGVKSFSHHLMATKYWFSRISWANKKRYILALLEDVSSAWTLSLLLKSLWNCRPKDAVLSVSQKDVLSSYDQVPMDHNRTAMPIVTLAQVMKTDRIWFLTLEPEVQALVLSELLSIAGGPVMWAVLRRAQILYERYRESQLKNLLECIVVNEREQERDPDRPAPEKAKKESPTPGKKSANGFPDSIQAQPVAQKELDANLAVWNATVKSIRDRQKLEEIEMTFADGTKKKIWKVNRPRPEAIETVDFLQLLPSSVGKLVMSFMPVTELGECAKVNKYWAYLVDEYRAELTARQKINVELDRLNEIMLRHDISLEAVEQIMIPHPPPSSIGQVSNALSLKWRPLPSVRPSERSAGVFSVRRFMNEKSNKPSKHVQRPLRNMADLSERLERRGAADENLWRWCESILRHAKPDKKQTMNVDKEEGVMALGNAHFPCPMMKHGLEVPLRKLLYKDPAMIPPANPRKNISNPSMVHAPKDQETKRYSLWTRDFSGLYPAFKIASYQSPV